MTAASPVHPRYGAAVWRSPCEPTALAEHAVHVWVTDLDSHFEQYAQLYDVLSERERQRVERLQVKLVADRYVVSRGLLRKLLSFYTGLETDALQFKFGSLGKPSLSPLPDGRTLSFNNTDSRELAIYAFSWDRELGIDLERLPRDVRAERISQRRFTQAEADAITSLEEPVRTEAFLGCWTRKEAWGKALGVGIRYPMDSIDLGSRPDRPEMLIEQTDQQWRLLQIRPDENSIACIIAQGTDWSPSYWQLTPSIVGKI